MAAGPSDEAVGSEAESKTADGKTASPPESESEAGPALEDVPTPDGVEELGGPKGPEPTRYGDWEKGGRCSDF